MNVITFELIAAFIKYITVNHRNEPFVQAVQKKIIEQSNSKEVDENGQPIATDQTGKIMYDEIFKGCTELLTQVLYDKLNLLNPNKKYLEIEYLKENLKNILARIFRIRFEENISEQVNIDAIINFYVFVFENIAYNVHEEIISLLNNTKKLSIMISILDLFVT
jgi:hypothetical protein